MLEFLGELSLSDHIWMMFYDMIEVNVLSLSPNVWIWILDEKLNNKKEL